MADTEFNKSALNKIVDNAVKKLIKEAQPRFDRPRRDHKGKPAVEIPNRGEIVLYGAPDGSVRLDVRLEKETVWLDLNQIAALFERDKSVISRHLRGIFNSGELDRGATVAKNATVQLEGDREDARIKLKRLYPSALLE